MLVGLVFGGVSVEHEVSVNSAKNVAQALKRSGFEPVLFYVDKRGFWHRVQDFSCLANGKTIQPFLVDLNGLELFHDIDLFFPLIHGTTGEDGSLQGLFEWLQKPYIGPGVAGSAISMDKAIAKQLVRAAGIDSGEFLVARKQQEPPLEAIKNQLGFPLFVKPVDLGSSVGVTKVYSEDALLHALERAYSLRDKIIIEKAIQGIEIEVGVIGYDQPIASLPIRLHVKHDFYSYEAKYQDAHGCEIEAPFQARPALIQRIQDHAMTIYRELGLSSMARIDFFLTADEKIIFNEVNTLPGFTAISGFPLAWQVSGMPLDDLIARLVVTAYERHPKRPQ